MAYSINTNITSLQAQDYLRVSSEFQGKTINRVTSGLRIISSGDDAAGLAIANSLRSDRSVITQGIRNANDGLSTLQTIDGGINNISQLLDRARTLAAQSASGTFNGQRSVLNSEFQSVIGEIDRQARAIGLDQGGQFAKSLSVFIGGGRGSNSADLTGEISNGSVSVDLTTSTVDAQSLGLKGVQAIGGIAGTTDIGNGTTSVANIVTKTENLNDLANQNTTEFWFAGPGFSRVKVGVNIQNVSSTSDLATRINSAITSAGGGGTEAASNFKEAGVTASIVTDSATGKQRLAFSSSNAAFQVQAGDKMANALLGNFTGATAEGASLTTSVTADVASAATTTAFGAAGAGNIVFRFTGAGLSSPKDITVTVSATDTIDDAIGALSTAIQNDVTLGGAGIALVDNGDSTPAAGDTLRFNSTRGEKFDVMVTGDVQNRLGFGSFQASATGEVDYASLLGGSYDKTKAAGNVTMEFSVNGSASSGAQYTKTVDLSSGNATQASVTSAGLAASSYIQSNNDTLNLIVDGTKVDVTLTHGSRTAFDIAGDINSRITANGAAGLASVEGGQIVIRSTAKGADATVQVLQGSANSTVGMTDYGIKSGDARTGADIATELNSFFSAQDAMRAAGMEASWDGGQNKLTITSNNGTFFRANSLAAGITNNGASVNSQKLNTSSDVAGFFVGDKSATSTLGVGASDQLNINIDGVGAVEVTLTAGVGRTNASIVAELNSNWLQNTSLWGGATATASVDSSGFIQITSDAKGAGTSVTVAAGTNSALAALGMDAGTTATAGSAGTATFSVTAAGSNNKMSIAIDGGAAVDVTISDNAVYTAGTLATELETQINAALLAANQTSTVTVTNDNGTIKIVSDEAGSASSIQFFATNNSAYSAIGLSTGVTYYGEESNAGYGRSGVTFAGNTVSNAPTDSQTFRSVGAMRTDALTFTAVDYGSNDQTIAITANDSSGAAHALSITLKNDGVSVRDGRSIDEAISFINNQIQLTNDSTLQKIVAVKENDGGTEKIRFLSTLTNFKVSAGDTANSEGIAAGLATADRPTTEAGLTADIATQSGAAAAVAAISTAVTTLGVSQANVGKGQNQFNFAVNLAQTQMNNLAAAESGIRDADLAMEAANLTKAQIMQQAGIAALAQANSAPQAVLSLLRG